MGSNSDLKSSRPRQNYAIVREKVLPNQAKPGLKHQEKFKGRNYVSRPCVNQPPELGEPVNDGILVQPRISGDHQQLSVKPKVTKDDELVKHMSYLPGYLQHMERGENVQDKALNIGVLDWARLEKWKYNRNYTLASNDNNASLNVSNTSSKVAAWSSISSTAVSYETLACHSRQLPSPRSSSKSSSNEGISPGGKEAIKNVVRFQDFGTTLKSGTDRQKRGERTYKSFGKINTEVTPEKGKTKFLTRKITTKERDWATNSRYNEILIKPKQSVTACDGEAEIIVQEMQELDMKRNGLDCNISLSNKVSSAQLKSGDHWCSPKESENIAGGKGKKRIEELQASAIDLSSDDQPGKREKIILLLPKALSRNFPPEESMRSFDANSKGVDQSSFTDSANEDVHSSEPSPEIPHSCPLPSRVETAAEPYTTTHPLCKTQCVDLSSDVSNTSAGLHKTQTMPQNNGAKATNVNLVETLKTLERETAELESGRARHPSPNRRFSFNLGRMTKSFSFKENSSNTQWSSSYVSVKSGPVTSRDSASSDEKNRENASGHRRVRSSPLRRMLEPILKPKSLNPLHSAETDQSLKANQNSFSLKTLNTIELLQNEKHLESNLQAFLQLTTRNGLPFFRFVANNKSSIFAAPTKNLTAPGKKDISCDYTFYTMDEFKKNNGSWINHGSKEKRCGYAYNVVGQMKLHSSSLIDVTGQNSISQYTVNESVLFGVELRQSSQPSTGFTPTRELAAAVVKTPGDILSLGTWLSHDGENLMEKGFCHLPENENFCRFESSEPNHTVTVILPGGFHGLPNRGLPSPLIQRWKSGGSCDCGGWDVGCKLQVLCNEKRGRKISESSEGCLVSDCFELFVQGGAQKDKPVLSLIAIENGLFAVQFSPLLSSLQALFICVTVVSCLRSSSPAEVSGLPDKMVLQETRNASYGIEKTKTLVPKEAPMKYAPSPPLSPVQRV